MASVVSLYIESPDILNLLQKKADFHRIGLFLFIPAMQTGSETSGLNKGWFLTGPAQAFDAMDGEVGVRKAVPAGTNLVQL